MPIIAKDTGGEDYENAPTGNQLAVCAFVEDIGTHRGEYQGVPNERHQIVICWELAETMTTGEYAGRPFMLSKFYTLSLAKKANLRQDLESWRGKAFTDEELKGFDVEKLKGVNCLLNVIEEKGRSKIASISPPIKGMDPLAVTNTEPPAWIDRKRQESIEATEGGGNTTVPEPEPYDHGDLPF